MPSNLRTPESPDPRDQEDAQRRWGAELERDRLAATIMEPGLPYPGPGAVSGMALGAARDQMVGDEDSMGGKAKGVAVDAAIAYATGPKGWIDFALKHKLVLGIVIGVLLLIQLLQWLPLFIMLGCMADQGCLTTIGVSAVKSIWTSVIDFIFG